MIKDNKLIEVVSILTTNNSIIIREYNNSYPNSGFTLKELPVIMDDESLTELTSVFTKIGEKCLKNSYNIKDEVIKWCNEGEEGYDYNFRFFVNKEQMNTILIEYRYFSQSLFEGTPNPIVPESEGYFIYINEFKNGADTLLIDSGVIIESNPNK